MSQYLAGLIFIIACVLFLVFRKKQRVVSFRQLAGFAYNSQTTREYIREILVQLTDEEQLMVGMNDDNGHDCMKMLVQRKHQSADMLICYLRPHSSTAWETIGMESLADILFESRMHEGCNSMEKWNIVTPAIEGKAFGEY